MKERNYHTESLYVPELENDACGIGLICNLKNKPSHQIVSDALTMLENMAHRGALGFDKNTGDGAGILIQIPHALYKRETISCGFDLPVPLKYGTGMLFLKNKTKEKAIQSLVTTIKSTELNLLGFRKVPRNKEILGFHSGKTEPEIIQIFVESKSDLTPNELENGLFFLRRKISKAWHKAGLQDNLAHICSLSCRTIVYKGYLTSGQLRKYYSDLTHPLLASALALVHSRFSTNTLPQWHLAQPFRYIAHNGEINTIQGNLNSWRARENEISTSEDRNSQNLFPLLNASHSDSFNMDRLIEYMKSKGKTLPEVLMTLIPEAYQNDLETADFKRNFYEYHEYLIEPWEGPASIVFTDGVLIGAVLDRNGLRPSRYYVTDDDSLILASEVGCLPVANERIIQKNSLKPGKMLVADLDEGRIITDEELKRTTCKKYPYGQFLRNHRIVLESLPDPNPQRLSATSLTLVQRQMIAGYTKEDLELIIKVMSSEGSEPIGSMGADVPLAVLSTLAQPIYNYFKQQFAQVTNPPIDPIRESFYMSLECSLGQLSSFSNPTDNSGSIIRLNSPILKTCDFRKIEHHFDIERIDISYLLSYESSKLQDAIQNICHLSEQSVNNGKRILVLEDSSISEDRTSIPALIAVGAVHHYLLEKGLRKKTSIVIKAGDIVETHHVACLLSFGADAIFPYLAIETARGQNPRKKQDSRERKYIQALDKGLLKIMSKLGISTVLAYKGAQTFEALGIHSEVIDLCFKGAVSRIGGMNFEMLEREALHKHQMAFVYSEGELVDLGLYQWKKNGEFHMFNPKSIHLLRNACRLNKKAYFDSFQNEINNQEEKACTLRSLLEVESDRHPIPLSEVEPIENILKRFATGAMSFGSLSYEAHTTLAIAMNRIGAKSNSGEGGEDPSRYKKTANGDDMNSAIKQVASGRFGVTAEYLFNAKELQIKIAQGAKPGEGGQLPGHKVNEWIARVRHTKPGTPLISPPPHHDIYSIEDLAQLIFDLKNANPQARISVKLVSKAGVGIIASGVTKAKAEHILISGHDGGTGASPLSSIRHAGLPWELGLAETHQVLMKNKLRSRVVLQVDGQIRTSKDLIIATLLGAEEYGISTAALVVEGCILLRKCHLNTCPVGIATQDPELRKSFDGKVEDVVNYFSFLAESFREQMAHLGFRTVNEMVGRSDLLRKRTQNIHWKAQSVDLSRLLFTPDINGNISSYCSEKQDFELENIIDQRLISQAKYALRNNSHYRSILKISNIDRAVGALLSYHITKKHGAKGLPAGAISYRMQGSAGQSFGAFCTKGIHFTLEGEANDYFGKGLSGARLVVVPDRYFNGNPQENVIVGNVALYGATSGEAYINGKSGERFCVRNSGAHVVVESIGNNGCEYMTGGRVIILREIGQNFGAGMSGGKAYAYTHHEQIMHLVNHDSVQIDVPDETEFSEIKALISRHFLFTSSKRALSILNNWDIRKKKFVKISPIRHPRKSIFVQDDQLTMAGKII